MATAVVGAAERMGYRPGLDGVRAAAVALVVAAHVGPTGGYGHGSIGVGVFFTLSGFLITKLLLEESERGGVSLGGFWLRRARRLLPALAFLLAVWFVVEQSAGPVLAGGLYASNYARIGGLEMGSLGHLWSLAVEEHFYLAWPLVFLAVRRRPFPILAAAYLALLAWRLAMPEARAYVATDARAGGILAGCLLAFYVDRHGLPVLPRWALPLSVAVAGWCWAYGTPLPWFELETFVGLVWIVAAMRWVPPRAVVQVGAVSYGIYLWHFPIAGWVDATTPPGWVVTISATVGAVGFSWLIIERRWLQRRPASTGFGSGVVSNSSNTNATMSLSELEASRAATT